MRPHLACGDDRSVDIAAKNNPLASKRGRELVFVSVMSASVKPRLAGRQPSNRGGVPWVMTRLSSRLGFRKTVDFTASAGPHDGPPERDRET